MKSDTLDNLKQTIVTEVETNKESLNKILEINKIVATIIKGPVVSIRTVAMKRRLTVAKPKLDPEDIRKIKESKKVLKDDLNSLYLYTLLVKVDDTLEKTDVKKISEEGRRLILAEASAIESKLSNRFIESK